jgi:hypothetical protein
LFLISLNRFKIAINPQARIGKWANQPPHTDPDSGSNCAAQDRRHDAKVEGIERLANGQGSSAIWVRSAAARDRLTIVPCSP